MKSLAIILLNYNGSVDTIECIESLDNTITNYEYDIYIIDNASQKEEVDILKRSGSTHPKISILEKGRRANSILRRAILGKSRFLNWIYQK